MSQKNEKLRRKVERVNADICELRSTIEAHGKRLDDAALWATSMNRTVRSLTTERNADRRRAREAERAVVAWRRMTYAVLVASIIVLVAAILVVNADAEDTDPIDPPVVVTAAETTPEPAEEPEEPENERIEAALLARAHVIEDCTITFYCNEQYPHICGTGDGIAYDGTPALAWATCAVDPDVIPLGSTVMVDLGDGEGLRTLVANDTGVRGNHIDICVGSHAEADQLGIQTAAVYWC